MTRPSSSAAPASTSPKQTLLQRLRAWFDHFEPTVVGDRADRVLAQRRADAPPRDPDDAPTQLLLVDDAAASIAFVADALHTLAGIEAPRALQVVGKARADGSAVVVEGRLRELRPLCLALNTHCAQHDNAVRFTLAALTAQQPVLPR